MPEGRAELRITRYLEAPASDVWAALTEAGAIARWLAPPGAVELAPGGAFELRVAGESSPMAGRVRALERERALELDWIYPGEPPSVVRFELASEGPGTKLVLEHRRLDDRSCMAYVRRWERHLDALEQGLPAASVAP
ncbi:MAG: SRPBCC domain-containing protein [Actinomycetota bacterium]|nr:SRPBCC domain-containing protein [Actinomycetota bacterium]